MNDTVINEIILEIQSKVDNGQLIELKSALERIFYKYEIKEKIDFEDTEYRFSRYFPLDSVICDFFVWQFVKFAGEKLRVTRQVTSQK